MARKSRREKPEIFPKVECPLRTAAYCRLSAEDREKDTIQAQIRLVEEFIRKHPDLKLEDTYVDNGFTGTNFNRPEWRRLMDDVHGGRIECIVVKDFSRFGRNYLETGYFLEFIFPKLHVRFLSVTENFDNTRQKDMEDLLPKVANIVNAAYAKDISRKMHISRDAAMERGERLKNTPPMGYMYVDDKKDHLVIDEEPAGVVRAIFYWASVGVGPTEIARRLEYLEVPSPRQWQRNRSTGESMDPPELWYPCSVNAILANRAYRGDTVTGMVRMNMNRPEKRDEKDWHVTEGTHEPIVSKELFEKVQALKDESKKRKQENRKKDGDSTEGSPLNGLVYCGVCGLSCAVSREKDAKLSMGYFFCRRPYPSQCTNRSSVPDRKLRLLVMDSISAVIRLLVKEENFLKGDNKDSPRSRMNREMKALQDQMAKTQERRDGLYEKYADGLIDLEEYTIMKESYRSEMEKLDGQIEEKAKEIRLLEQKYAHIREILDKAGRRTEPIPFDEELVRALVERVEIFDDKHIVVHFKFQDELRRFVREEEEG